MSHILQISFYNEYLLSIRKKILDALYDNKTSCVYNGKLEPFAEKELVSDGYKVEFVEEDDNFPHSAPSFTIISWNYDHLNKVEE